MKNKKLIITICLFVLVVAGAILLIKMSRDNADGCDCKIALSSGISIVRVEPYSGEYFESHAGDAVDNIAAVIIENSGSDMIQAGTACLKTGDVTYEFYFTTLLPGEKMLVLEKNKAEFTSKLAKAEGELVDVIYFSEKPTMCDDAVEIKTEENSIYVKNISDFALTGGHVFYKNFDAESGMYMGGITYMATFNGLGVGEIAAISADHYSPFTSKIVFVTYA